jgi:hypothetical protein
MKELTNTPDGLPRDPTDFDLDAGHIRPNLEAPPDAATPAGSALS